MPAKSAKKKKDMGASTNREALNRQLQTAILAKDEAGVRAAVERGADVDGVMASGYRGKNMAHLHHVAAHGNSSMVWLLWSIWARTWTW